MLTARIPPARRRAALLLLATIAAAGIVLHLVHPARIAALPPCPSRAVLHIYCPGCGSTRAVHHLANARFADAWAHNPALIVLGLPAAAWFLATLMTEVALGRSLIFPINVRWLGWAILAALVVYFAARNVPLECLDWLRPPAPA